MTAIEFKYYSSTVENVTVCFVWLSSVKRRYKVVCKQHGSFFLVEFAFSQAFSPPAKVVLHSSQVSESSRRLVSINWETISYKSSSQRYGHNSWYESESRDDVNEVRERRISATYT